MSKQYYFVTLRHGIKSPLDIPKTLLVELAEMARY